MSITDKDQYLLKIKDGRLVTAQLDMKMNLRAVDTQNEGQNGQRVCIIQNPQKPQMAFFFKRGNYYYTPKVEGDKLKLEEKRNKDAALISTPNWFEKVNFGNGDHYGLKSVVEPNLYVCRPNDNPSIFFLGDKKHQCVLVKHEKI